MTAPAKTPRAELSRLEATVYRNLRHTRDGIDALLEIFARELWQEAPAPRVDGKPRPYTSWKDYLARRWPTLNVNAMHRRIKAADARARLERLELFGASQLSDRAVGVIADADPESQAAALELAQALAEGQTPTEDDMRAALDAVEEGTPEEEVAATRREEEEAKAEIRRRDQAEQAAKSLAWLAKAKANFERFLRKLGQDEAARKARAQVIRGIRIVEKLIQMVEAA